MYIKFYNALGRDDPLAGRGQSPVPKGHGPGQAPHTPYTLSHILAHTLASSFIKKEKCTSSDVLVHLVILPLGQDNIQSNTSQQFERYTVPQTVICARLLYF